MEKKKIAWITDSTAFITDELKNNPDVYVLPLQINFGEESFEDGIDLNTEQLYERINNDKEVPTTSQPSVGKFVELFEELKQKYEKAIAVHISSEISGTISSCHTAAKIANFEVGIVDSKSMSYAITTLINKGIEMAKEKIGFESIRAKLQEETQNSENYILLGSLEQFYKGGRMSGTQYLLGTVLKIKPIIQINSEGKFLVFEKVRSEARAIRRMVELFQNSYENNKINQLQIMHGNIYDKAIEFKEEILKKIPNINIFIGEISSTIAAHAGEGTLSLIWHKEK